MATCRLDEETEKNTSHKSATYHHHMAACVIFQPTLTKFGTVVDLTEVMIRLPNVVSMA